MNRYFKNQHDDEWKWDGNQMLVRPYNASEFITSCFNNPEDLLIEVNGVIITETDEHGEPLKLSPSDIAAQKGDDLRKIEQSEF